VIKESDLMFTKNYNDVYEHPQESKKYDKLQIPTRVVMNNQTVTIFAGDNYENQVMSLNMRDTEFRRQVTSKDCFLLVNRIGQKAELCPFSGSGSQGNIIEEWDYDFNLFKNQCFTPKEKITELGLTEAELKRKLEEKMVYIVLTIESSATGSIT
jgi:hypothetical protein